MTPNGSAYDRRALHTIASCLVVLSLSLSSSLSLSACNQGTLSGLAMDASSGIGFAVGAGHAVC